MNMVKVEVSMSRRQCSATERAVKEWSRTLGNVYKIAAKHGVAASTLYRAIKSAGGDRKK